MHSSLHRGRYLALQGKRRDQVEYCTGELTTRGMEQIGAADLTGMLRGGNQTGPKCAKEILTLRRIPGYTPKGCQEYNEKIVAGWGDSRPETDQTPRVVNCQFRIEIRYGAQEWAKQRPHPLAQQRSSAGLQQDFRNQISVFAPLFGVEKLPGSRPRGL